MDILLGLLLLLSLPVQGLECDPGKVWIELYKKNSLSAGEESHVISKPDTTVLYTSPAFANSEVKTEEFCLDASTNDQYLIKLKDSGSNSWYSSSYLRISGLYGTQPFVRFMTAPSEENHYLSLLMPIKKLQTWKFSNSPSVGWNGQWDDSAWASVTLPTPIQATLGTQYFRKTFSYTTSLNLAAFETRFFYSHGTIAWVNGVELFRDNMFPGEASASTSASGSYSDNAYRGVIRNALILTSSSVLAIELHFKSDTTITTINFDGWLAVYAQTHETSNTQNCYSVGYIPVTPVASGGTSSSLANGVDYAKSTVWYISSFSPPASISTSFNNIYIGFNGLEIFPLSNPQLMPMSVIVSGCLTDQLLAGTYTTVGSAENKVYATNTYAVDVFPFALVGYKSFRLTVPTGYSTTAYVYEFRPLVCNIPFPQSIEFQTYESPIHVLTENLVIKPKHVGVSGCSVVPVLPSGITINSATCIISGVAQVASPSTSYVVTSTTPALTGTVTLAVQICDGASFKIDRTYTNSAAAENFAIKNTNGDTLYAVNANSGQPNAAVVSSTHCLSSVGHRFSLTVGSTSLYWAAGSYIDIFAIIDGNNYEQLLRCRYDTVLNTPATIIFSLARPVPPSSQWKYNPNYSSNDWASAITASWEEKKRGEFTAPNTRFQVYRKTFIITASELTNVAGFSVAVLYKYGIVISMNGNEVFRNHVLSTGELSTLSINNMYDELKYRIIGLPLKTVSDGVTGALEYMKAGSNEIAIALISTSDDMAATFDAAIRLYGNIESDRTFDLYPSKQSINGEASYVFSKYYYNLVDYNMCSNNFIQVQFNNDRREWLSSITLVNAHDSIIETATQFQVQGKSGESAYVTLSDQRGWKWWSKCQYKKTYFVNNKSYSMYRINNIGSGNPTACKWRLNQIILWADKTDVPVPTLTYESPNHGYKDIEMAEIFPLGTEYKSNFRLKGDSVLPTGVYIDPPSGVIMGTPVVLMTMPVMYEVESTGIDGNAYEASFSLDVNYCENPRSLISIVIGVDSSPSTAGFKLTAGSSGSGSVVIERPTMPQASSKFWVDQCLVEGTYTFTALDTNGGGWLWPNGFFMTIDRDSLTNAFEHMADGNKNLVFMSTQPFQLEFTKWKIYKLDAPIAANWFNTDFEDNTWAEGLASSIGSDINSITVYTRKRFTIDDVSVINVMNVHVQYMGGVVAYFNGKKIARFNLPTKFDRNTYGFEQHDLAKFSAFHVIMQTDDAVSGSNVIAFEIHRYVGSSSSQEVKFDASAIYSLEECSIAAVSYSMMIGSAAATNDDRMKLLDGDPLTIMSFLNVAGNNITVSFENMELNEFNKYYFTSNYVYTGYTFSLNGKHEIQDEYTRIVTTSSYATLRSSKNVFAAPVGMVGFNIIQLSLDYAGQSAIGMSEFGFLYCKVPGTPCDRDGDYPPVGAGEISPALCAPNYQGYRTKTCTGGQLVDESLANCRKRPPMNLSYNEKNTFSFVVGTDVRTPVPNFDNIIDSFYIETTDEQKKLPYNLHLDAKTGEISGNCVDKISTRYVDIYGKNDGGADIVMVTLDISSRYGACAPVTKDSHSFPATPVGDTPIVFQCNTLSGYIGTTKRTCKLGVADGEWTKETGMCISVTLIVVLALVVVVVIPIVLIIVIRVTRSRSKGGKKGSKTKPKQSAKSSTTAASKKTKSTSA